MNIFEKTFNLVLNEDNTSSTAFGSIDAGSTGGQFPAQNSKGFNDGDNRPIDPNKAILGLEKKHRKKQKIKIHRRSF